MVQVGKITEALVHVLTDKMISFECLQGTVYEKIPWLLGRLLTLVDFDSDLLLAAVNACGDDERYEGLKAEFYQSLETPD